MIRSLACLVVAASLVGAPRTAAAAEPSAASTSDDALAEAKARHTEADAKYNTADYEGAIAAWQAAFAALPRTPEANTYRSLILYNIASAHEKLYSLRGDVEQLKRARILLDQFERSIDEIYAGAPEDGEHERKQVRAKIERIDALIAAADDEPEPTAPATKPPEKVESTAADVPPRERRRGSGLVIGGGVALGLGVIALGGMTGALVLGSQANDISGLADDELQTREEQFDRGRRANAAAIGVGIAGAVLVSTGVALVVIGVQRRARTTALAPSFGRSSAGLVLHGRF